MIFEVGGPAANALRAYPRAYSFAWSRPRVAGDSARLASTTATVIGCASGFTLMRSV